MAETFTIAFVRGSFTGLMHKLRTHMAEQDFMSLILTLANEAGTGGGGIPTKMFEEPLLEIYRDLEDERDGKDEETIQ